MRRIVITAVILVGLLAAFVGLLRAVPSLSGLIFGPDPESVASSSLTAVQQQNRLVALTAQIVTVTTNSRSRFGFSTERTMIIPALVRYELNLGALTRRDVAWDAASKTLKVQLPPIELAGPQVDLEKVKTYGSGGLLARTTNVNEEIDIQNRRAGLRDILVQARQPALMNLAKQAATSAVANNFLLPLRATGLKDVKVEVRFADDPTRSTERMDASRSLQEVLGNAI